VYSSRAAVPDHKNDHRFGEQKNDPLVRAYLGFERLDTLAPTQAVNVLYDKMWLYYNLFQPVLRLQEKTFVPLAGRLSKVQRHYDQAQTPFDRLCHHGHACTTARGSGTPARPHQPASSAARDL
jgi:hypothetical protein